MATLPLTTTPSPSQQLPFSSKVNIFRGCAGDVAHTNRCDESSCEFLLALVVGVVGGSFMPLFFAGVTVVLVEDEAEIELEEGVRWGVAAFQAGDEVVLRNTNTRTLLVNNPYTFI